MTSNQLKQYNDYKKSNKERRVKLLAKYGFKNETKYLDSLKSAPVVNTTPVVKVRRPRVKVVPKKVTKVKMVTKKQTIHNVFIMDDSGSMHGGKYINGVKGIQELVKSIQVDKLTNNTISIVDLNRGVEAWMADPNTVNYKAHTSLGDTPLYKTIGRTIKNILKEVKKGDKVLLNIVTDGQDNCGWGEYIKLPQTIKDVQKNNNFTVTFVGTAQDVKYIQHNLNIDKSNTLVHDNTATGMKRSFHTTSVSRQAYSSNVSKGLVVTNGFYKSVGTLED